ncbi:MAG: hypothetical protein AAF194_03580 [Pseudomonadota bacterium]
MPDSLLAPNPFDYQRSDGTLDHLLLHRALLDHAAACDLAEMPRCAAIAVALTQGPNAIRALVLESV